MNNEYLVSVSRRLSVKSFAKQFYDGSVHGVYKLIFNAKQTGFDNCIKRIGKKIWIDVVEYYKWQDEYSEKCKKEQKDKTKKSLNFEEYAENILKNIPESEL